MDYESRSVACLAIAAIVFCAGMGPAHARDDASAGLELGFLAGAVALDEELSGVADRYEPFVGVRIAGRLVDRWRWFGNAWYASTSTDTFAGDAELLAGRAGLEWIVAPEMRWQPFFSAAWGYEFVTFDDADDFTSAFVALGLGQQRRIAARGNLRWELSLERTLAPDGLRGHDLMQAEVAVGYGWSFGRTRTAVDRDPDRDGVSGRRDRCPETPFGATVDAAGCPQDTDGDGVFDGLDRCPQTPAGQKVGADGCAPDADGDGVPDSRDRCPESPPGAVVDETGCVADADGDGVSDALDACPGTLRGIEVGPDGCFLDRDGDGVYDGLGMDHCLDTPLGAVVDRWGCPLDGDGDGVYDGLDACPDTPAGQPVDDRGCPQD